MSVGERECVCEREIKRFLKAYQHKCISIIQLALMFHQLLLFQRTFQLIEFTSSPPKKSKKSRTFVTTIIIIKDKIAKYYDQFSSVGKPQKRFFRLPSVKRPFYRQSGFWRYASPTLSCLFQLSGSIVSPNWGNQ